MATKAKTKQPSPAQLRARRKFAAAAKARAKAARAAKKAAAPKKRAAAKAPSAAQLRARKKFAAAAKARAKAARANKRNSTNIRAKRIDHLDVAKVHNSGGNDLRRLEATLRILKGDLAYRSKAPLAAMPEDYINRADWKIDVQQAIAKTKEQIALHHLKKTNPRRGMRKIAGQARRFTEFAAIAEAGALPKTAKAIREARDHDKKFMIKALRGQRAYNKRKNADHRDAKHPIHVTDYWQGRPGYKTQWQRAHEGGQRQLFQVKNPKAFSKSTVIGSQLWKALPADQRAVIVRQVAQLDNWRQAHVLKLVQRVTGATKQPATYITAFLKIGYTVPLSVIEQAQRAGDPAIIDAYKKSGRARNGAGAALARKRRAEFVGRPSKKTISTYAPKGSGAKPHSTLVAMGKLKKVYIKDRTPLNFNGAAILAHDPKTDKMFVLGREYTLKHLKKNPDGFEDLGEVTRIEYEATKTHLGDETPVTYFHKLGEEGGEKPHAVINEENLLLLEGGDYYITPEGIRD